MSSMQDMTQYIRLIRYPYEEPYHLHLSMTASNGRVRGRLEFYLGAQELMRWAEGMETFPLHARSVLLWELGSERPEDRWSCYFRLRVFTVDAQGHSAIQFRFNNNAELPDREITEFCIRTDPAAINRLGQLCRVFADMRHEVLEWSPASERLFESIEDPEQEFARER
jgi:hypothetical protein